MTCGGGCCRRIAFVESYRLCGCKKKATYGRATHPRIPVTTPLPPRPSEERVPIRRAILWTIVAVVLAAGVVLYFLYGREVVPLIDPGS